MSIKLMAAVFDDELLDQAETLTMLALADWANDDGRCWPSLPQLVRKTRLSERGLREIIRRLVDQGVLEKTDIAGKGTKYVVKPRHYVPPRHEMPPAPDAATPARRAANTSIPVKKPSRAKALSGSREGKISFDTNMTDDVDFKHYCIEWSQGKKEWARWQAEAEFERFENDAKAHNRKYSSWRAAWRNWCSSPLCKTVPIKRQPLYV